MKGVIAFFLSFLHFDVVGFNSFLVARHLHTEVFALTQVNVGITIHYDVGKRFEIEGLSHYFSPFLAVTEVVFAVPRLNHLLFLFQREIAGGEGEYCPSETKEGDDAQMFHALCCFNYHLSIIISHLE